MCSRSDEHLGEYGSISDCLGSHRQAREADDVRHVLQRVPGQLLAALDRLRAGSARDAGVRAPGRSSSTARPPRATSSARSPRSSRPPSRPRSSFDLPLKPFIDGGWYWFDLEAGERAARPRGGDVGGRDRQDHARVRVSLGITTYNRPDFCVDQLVKLSEQPEVLAIVDEIYRHRPGHPEGRRPRAVRCRRQARSGRKLRLIEQGNLGGSGGFSRAMDEATDQGRRRLRPAARRRRGLRAGGHPARRDVRRPGQEPDDRRWPHVQPLRPVGDAHVR